MLTISVVSDATGETAERVMRLALVSFEGADVATARRRPRATSIARHAPR